MFTHRKVTDLNAYFSPLSGREDRTVYFGRINRYSEAVHAFLLKYFEDARKAGVLIEGKLPNPDEKNLSYYRELMGDHFQLDRGFIQDALRKWLPRMNDAQRKNVAESMYSTLTLLKEEGRNEAMLKNAYVKFMCWFYYRLERIVNRLGSEKLPKILYEGEISRYELLMMSLLSSAGCDILLLQKKGDGPYLRLDPASALSDEIPVPGGTDFPPSFGLKGILAEIREAEDAERLYRDQPKLDPCTNAWLTGKIREDLLKAPAKRGNDPGFFYNLFVRINGVPDRLTYLNDLYQLGLELQGWQRNVLIMDKAIPKPDMEEISQIQRGNYQTRDQMILGLSRNLIYPANPEVQKLMQRAFVDLILSESRKTEMSLPRLTNRAVYLLCWIRRYQGDLFRNWNPESVSVFIHMGPLRDETEAMMLRFLAHLPVDVLILRPNLNENCVLKDPLLYEQSFPDSLIVEHYPRDGAAAEMGTAAYYAERDLDTLMYQDTGIYRTRQYKNATVLTLRTMYEEISILWDQELRYRTDFQTRGDLVTLPVLYAKVSGVKDGNVELYWKSIKALLTEETKLITGSSFYDSLAQNPVKAYAAGFLKNGKLQRQKILEHKCYQYGFLRQEMQDYMLDKLQLMIEQRIISGTFENGTEYTIIATVLNLDRSLLRLIQNFDFTKKNPKIVWIMTGEMALTLEDTILVTFLHLCGFDIVFFVPTGYQCIEKYAAKRLFEEHQIGPYIYDLTVPDFKAVSGSVKGARMSLRELFFKRGN